MMKLVVLAGLITVEKIQLARELASFFKQQALKVLVLDNVARLPMKPGNFDVPVQRITDDITIQLKHLLQNSDADLLILALSEQIHPDDCFIMLENLSDTIAEIDIRSIALLDTRTCDCFPNLRENLEQYADLSIYLPYRLDEVLNYLSH